MHEGLNAKNEVEKPQKWGYLTSNLGLGTPKMGSYNLKNAVTQPYSCGFKPQKWG